MPFQVFPPRGIKIVSVLLHSHQSSRAMRLRHVRGNSELPHIVENNKYDVHYQVDRILEQEVIVFPTDHLITECDYTTVDRKNPSMVSGHREGVAFNTVSYYRVIILGYSLVQGRNLLFVRAVLSQD